MTLWNASMVPPSITTTEALAVWLAEIHQLLYADVVSIESLDINSVQQKTRSVSANIFYLTAPNVPIYRHVSRLSLQISGQYRVNGKPWLNVTQLGDSAIPDGMKT